MCMYNMSAISFHPHFHTQIILSYTLRELQTSDPTTERRRKDAAFVCPPSSSSGTVLAHSTLSSSHHCVHSCLVFIALSAVIHHAGWYNTTLGVALCCVCVWVVFIVNTSPSGSNNCNRLISRPISSTGSKQLIAPPVCREPLDTV